MTTSTDRAPRPRLSVAMIVLNEEAVLGASLQSVEAIADEIVVLDTGSTDRTLAVAEQYGAATGRMEWTEDFSFSAARNRCLEQVRGDWVLWLDAGETLDEESAAALRTFIDREADLKKAYMLMIQVPPADSGASAEQVLRPRLIPNHPQLRFEGRIRETLRPALEAAGIQIDTAAGQITRHARHHDPGRKALRAERDLWLVARELAEQRGSPPRLFLARGDAYSDLGAQENARAAFLQAIEVAEHGSTEMLEGYYGLLSSYDSNEFLRDVQLSTCLEVLEIFPFDAQLLLVMGNYLQNKKRADLAARSFQTAVQHGQVDLETWHLTELAEVASDCLSLTLQIQGQHDEARAVLEEAFGRYQNSSRLRRRLLDLYVKQSRLDEAIELADQLVTGPEGREPLYDAVRGACKAAKGEWTEALGYLQSAYVAGCRDPFCLRWLCVTLLSNGQVEAASPVLLEWKQIEPDNVELQAYLTILQQQQEMAASEGKSAGELSESDVAERQLRIDQGTAVLEVGPPRFPIISQAYIGAGFAQQPVAE